MPSARRIGRTLRTRVAPWTVWLLTMGAAGWLWYDNTSNAPVMGYAKGVEYKVAASRAGRIESISVEVGQEVQSGQVLAVLDGRELDGQVAVLEAEVARTRARRKAAAAQAVLDRATLVERMDEAVATAERDLVRAKQRKRVRGAQLKALRARRKQLDKLLSDKLVTRDRRDGDLAVELAGAREEVGAARPEVALLETQLGAVKKRRASLVSADSDKALLAPFDAEIKVLQRRIDGLMTERRRLLIRAPATGRIAQVMLRRGEVAALGMPLVTVVGDDKKDRIVACLDEARALSVQLGTAVEVKPRGARATFKGRVVALSPRVGALPVQCRHDPRVEVWGREVMVALDTPTDLVAGQRFVVAFKDLKQPGAEGGSARAGQPKRKAPSKLGVVRPLPLPERLKRMTRFEASGITWVPSLDRYVIVSDDTGFKKSNDAAPWVFTMDRHGALDPEPLAVTGVPEWSDLEGVAPADGGGLWVIASNSASSKGRRPKKRQVFTRLIPESGRAFSSTRAVYLFKLLQKASPDTLAELGLGLTGGLNRLNIEGLAAYPRGGLLIGLKAPLDDKGRALIWHLRYPQRLLDTGSLAAGELTRWASVGASCSDAKGTSHSAGIAELVFLPDGGLVFAATTSDGAKRSKAGALYYVRDPQPRQGVLSARKLRAFPKLKPEGLAVSPIAGRMTVVFDLGQKEPKWAELPWPRR